MVVVDSSAVIDFLVELDAHPRLVHIMLRGGLHAVTLIDLEVMHTLRKMLAARRLSEKRATDVLTEFWSIPIVRHPHADLLHRIWQLRHNITAYDAAYVALAEKLAAPLVTRDARLARATGHAARIEHIA